MSCLALIPKGLFALNAVAEHFLPETKINRPGFLFHAKLECMWFSPFSPTMKVAYIQSALFIPSKNSDEITFESECHCQEVQNEIVWKSAACPNKYGSVLPWQFSGEKNFLSPSCLFPRRSLSFCPLCGFGDIHEVFKACEHSLPSDNHRLEWYVMGPERELPKKCLYGEA